ncbi:MAG: HEAT repeat domain-containing protein [Verrucomicrobiota bacterium]
MSTAEHTSTQAVKARRLTRSRVLWGMIGLCLVLWGITAIRSAMQSKHQGKTMEEWFDEIKVSGSIHFYVVPTNQPAYLAITSRGTNALPVLKAKFEQPDAPPLNKGTQWLLELLGQEIPVSSQENRRIKVVSILRELGPKGDSLVPFFLTRLQDADRQTRMTAGLCLNAIGTRPGDVIPAMIPLLGFEQTPAPEYSVARLCIARYADQADVAVPLLLTALNSTNHFHRLRVAATLTDFGRTQEVLQYLQNEAKDSSSPHQTEATDYLAWNGTNASALFPLRTFFYRLTGF